MKIEISAQKSGNIGNPSVRKPNSTVFDTKRYRVSRVKNGIHVETFKLDAARRGSNGPTDYLYIASLVLTVDDLLKILNEAISN
jgi:hypothetical protein